MDTKTVHKQLQKLLFGGRLSGGVHKNLIPL